MVLPAFCHWGSSFEVDFMTQRARGLVLLGASSRWCPYYYEYILFSSLCFRRLLIGTYVLCTRNIEDSLGMMLSSNYCDPALSPDTLSSEHTLDLHTQWQDGLARVALRRSSSRRDEQIWAQCPSSEVLAICHMLCCSWDWLVTAGVNFLCPALDYKHGGLYDPKAWVLLSMS